MARYIDANKLCEGLKDMARYQMRDKQSTILGVVSTIENYPTADVVPRAEVEELIRENESLAKTVNEASELIRKLRSKVAPTVSKMEQVRNEIIRDIFDEIEDVLDNIGYFDELDFKSLKKKYTERRE